MQFGAAMFFTDASMPPQELGPLLEERGFESIWVPEHSHVPSSRTTPFPSGGTMLREYYEIMDPFVALTAVAITTTTLKLGTGVCLVNQRDAIQTAKLVSSLDQLSHGRFLFGVGDGWNREEMENHGTAFETRHKLVRERIEAMKLIWTQEEPEYHGELVKFDKMKMWPKPVQKPHPPIIVGGAFPYGARRAIRYGHGWIPHAARPNYEDVGQFLPEFHSMARDAGREPSSLPISLFRVPPDLGLLRRYRDAGVARVVITVPAEKRDGILPILDQWTPLMEAIG